MVKCNCTVCEWAAAKTDLLHFFKLLNLIQILWYIVASSVVASLYMRVQPYRVYLLSTFYELVSYPSMQTSLKTHIIRSCPCPPRLLSAVTKSCATWITEQQHQQEPTTLQPTHWPQSSTPWSHERVPCDDRDMMYAFISQKCHETVRRGITILWILPCAMCRSGAQRNDFSGGGRLRMFTRTYLRIHFAWYLFEPICK